MPLNILLLGQFYLVYSYVLVMSPFPSSLPLFVIVGVPSLLDMCLNWSKSTNTNNLKNFQTAGAIVICWHLPELRVIPEMGAGESLVSCHRHWHFHIFVLKPKRPGQLQSVIKRVGGWVGGECRRGSNVSGGASGRGDQRTPCKLLRDRSILRVLCQWYVKNF